ncbi:IS1595 family transposase [Mariniflexile sp.]
MDLRNIIKELSQEQKEELAQLLNRDLNIPKSNQLITDLNRNRPVSCPHCESIDIYGHGTYKSRKRYKCKSCTKTFNDLTGTAMDGIKKVEKFQDYLVLMIESMSIRKASKKLEVNVKTIFDWRHKLLSSLSILNGEEFSGIVECDDKQLDINNKGGRELERNPYKRPSDRQAKRGVSNDKVSIMVATDRNNNPMMRIAKVGRIDTESVEKTMGALIKPENVLCSDSHPSIIKWAKEKEVEHHTFIASKHIKNKCYHVQHVNSIDNLYERWVKPFYGVSTKYLSGYLNWFVFLQKIKNSRSQIADIARIIVKNAKAMNTYKSIEENYKELTIPHYSKT